jgi:hypothetical protein
MGKGTHPLAPRPWQNPTNAIGPPWLGGTAPWALASGSPGKLRGRKYSLLPLVHRGVLLILSYNALLASLIALTKSMLTLIADKFKVILELARGP